MDWQLQLISIYLFVCKHYQGGLCWECQRMANYADLSFSDEEVLTIFLFGVIDKKKEIKDIHRYAERHLQEFFPNLPGYGAYVQRLNKLCGIFIPLISRMQDFMSCEIPFEINNLTDSMPIVIAKHGRRFNAKTANEIATANGYCSTKKMYYYGVKLHVVAARRPGMLPLPHLIGLTDAGMHDRKAYDLVEDMLFDPTFADKAYQLKDKPILEQENSTLYTPVKKKKGQEFLDSADKLLSTAISQVRQPIESLFNWINEKTGIQMASKVRSYNGLMVHAFGKLAAALFLLFKPI